MSVKDVTFSAGYITVTRDSGPPTKYAIAEMLRAADIPVLTIDKLTVLTKLAEVVALLVKTLIEMQVLGESFVDGYDLQYIVDTLEDDLDVNW